MATAAIENRKIVRPSLRLGHDARERLPPLLHLDAFTFSSHLEICWKRFRRSRTVAVFIVIHMYRQWTSRSRTSFASIRREGWRARLFANVDRGR